MIDFPQKPRLVAITNGSGFGKEQGTDGVSYKPGDRTLYIYTGRWFIARAVGDKYNGPNEVTVFWGSYIQSTPVVEMVVETLTNWLGEWFSNIITWVYKTVQVVFTDIVEMKNTLPLDNTSGGWRNTNEFFAKSLLFNAHAEFGRHNHSFIPTYSAMGIHLNQIPNENITLPMNAILNTSTYPVYNSPKSPFHAIYAPMSPDANYEHITVNDENIGWIMNEVSPHDLFLQNRPLSPYNPIVDNSPLNGWAYEARNTITMGKNVTNTLPIGDFVVYGDGSTGATVDFRAGQSITLKDGTWFKKGSNVHLFIKPFECTAACRMANTNTDGGREHQENPYVASANNNWSDFTYNEKINGETNNHQLPATNYQLITYPNPFTDHTHIDYTIKDSVAVNISIYDYSGKKVQELINTNSHLPGNFTVTFDARKYNPGIYFCRMVSENFSETKKMVMIK